MHPDAQAILAAAGLLVVGGAVSAAVSPKRTLVGPVALFFVVLASALSFVAALRVLLTGQVAESGSLFTVPMLNAQLLFRVDALSALFVMIIAVIGTLTTLYSLGYMNRYPDEHLIRYYPSLLLCFASILGLICAADWFFFIIFWEIMSVCSYTLVVFERRNPVALRAGFKYIIMTHAATAAMFIAMIVLWEVGNGHNFTFDYTKSALAQVAESRPLLTHVLLALWLIGFGTKAGLLPLGSWLPDAYPAAPSGASAMFGGSLTKLGIYGMLRIFCWMLPPSGYSQVWGMAIAIIGAGSVFVGTLSTLPEHVAHDDSKRFLSFHAIGQIGYMMLGIGMGIYFLPTHPVIAVLALVAAVFHLLNNVLYKSLLFLTSGSVLYRTGTRDLNKVSGLGAMMPVTAMAAAIAALSIAGVPPSNGFVSKWMLYGVSILSPQTAPVFVILGVLAMFISLVTLASFVKYIGTAFLGPLAAPKNHTLDRGDVPQTMQVPQVVLAGLCVTFGLVPVLPLLGVHRAIMAVVPSVGFGGPEFTFEALFGGSPAGLQLLMYGHTAGVWLPLVVLVVLAVCIGLSVLLARAGGATHRRVREWQCGTDLTNQATRYQARSFYGPFKKAFHHVYPMVGVPKLGYPHALGRLSNVDQWLYAPIVAAGLRASKRLSRTHAGIPQLYLVWQIAGMAVVVAVLFWLLR